MPKVRAAVPIHGPNYYQSTRYRLVSTAMLLMVPTTRGPATGVDGHALVDAIVMKL